MYYCCLLVVVVLGVYGDNVSTPIAPNGSTLVTPSTISTPTPCGLNLTCLKSLNLTTSSSTTAATVSTPKRSPNRTPTSSTTTKKPKRNIKHKYQKESNSLNSKKYFCTCDLQEYLCDINCCCDKDCTDDDKLIFTYCYEEDNQFFDTRNCDYKRYIYLNATPHEWQVSQNSLFCVVRKNLPNSYTVQKKQPIKDVDEALDEKKLKCNWFGKDENVLMNEINFKERFAYGNSIWTIVNSTTIKKLRFPKPFVTQSCIMQEDVMALKNRESKCDQMDISDDNPSLTLSTYVQNISIISSPHLLNFTLFQNKSYQECLKNVCLPIETKLCAINFNDCVNMENNQTIPRMKCNFNVRKNINTCTNVVKAIKYALYHNGSDGLKKAQVYAVLENISFAFVNQYSFLQEFQIKFLWYNKSDTATNYSRIRSGNPGYIIGKPILTGVLTANSTNLIRNSDKYINNFLVLPENLNSKCVLDEEHFVVIEFGYNLQTHCSQKVQIGTQNLNATQICQDYQKSLISNTWSINNETNRIIGMFGNANANNLNDWIELLFEKQLNIVMNETYGTFANNNKSLICYGIATNLLIEVFHSRIDFENLLNQHKILGTLYSFTEIRNLSFAYHKFENMTLMETVVSTQVMFYDITAMKKKKFVDPPSFKISLPHDFFYPFIKIENSGSFVGFSRICIILSCFIVIFI